MDFLRHGRPPCSPWPDPEEVSNQIKKDLAVNRRGCWQGEPNDATNDVTREEKEVQCRFRFPTQPAAAIGTETSALSRKVSWPHFYWLPSFLACGELSTI
jgi:hypothetical protein